MRGLVRRRGLEEEEDSAFVSMTDMTVSFLFIVILLLAFFASQYSPDEVVARSLHERVLAERDAAEKARAAAEAERDALTVELQESRVRLDRVTQERDEVLRALAALRLEMIELREALEIRARRIVLLETRLAGLEATIRELNERIAELEQRLSMDNPLEKYGYQATELRRRILERLAEAVQSDIDQRDIEGLTVSAQGDALRFVPLRRGPRSGCVDEVVLIAPAPGQEFV